jgi:hypothetical protein
MFQLIGFYGVWEYKEENEITIFQYKRVMPNKGVFDEKITKTCQKCNDGVNAPVKLALGTN